MTFLFISLARHQGLYFNRLIREGGVRGKVVEPSQMPLPGKLHVSSVLSRVDFEGLIEEKCEERRIKNKNAGYLYRLLLKLELIWMALRAQALLDRERPGALVVWNGAHRYCKLLIALAPAECKVFYFENGLLPDTTTLDTRGVNYLNSVPRDPAFYLNYPYSTSGQQAPAVLIPRKPRVSNIEPVALPERFIFIPFQDDRDSQVRLFSPWIANMCELFVLGERLARDTGMTVVFKEHPSSRESYPQLHERTTENLLFANGNATQQLIESSEFVITLNSTVGLESLLLGKPVMTLGQAFFNIEGLVAHADSADQAVEKVRAFPDWSLDARLRSNFLHYLAEHYCVKGHWKTADEAQILRVAGRMTRELGLSS